MVLVVVWLALADAFVRPALARLERTRYEGTSLFRFENSDLFGLGPLVEYLRENPVGARPRTLFFGNSMIWGYGVEPEQTVPAHYQQLNPSTKVLNVAINGFSTGNSLLIARAVIDSVDRLYVLRQGTSVSSRLPELIPIDADDLRAFGLRPPNRLETMLEDRLGFWHLYRYSYRLQMAMFGSSTPQFIYRNHKHAVRAVVAKLTAAESSRVRGRERVNVLGPMTSGPVPRGVAERLEREQRQAWEFATLARDHRKRLVLLHVPGYSGRFDWEDIAAFNALFSPYAQLVVLEIPRALRPDGLHFDSAGARSLAEALTAHATHQSVDVP